MGWSGRGGAPQVLFAAMVLGLALLRADPGAAQAAGALAPPSWRPLGIVLPSAPNGYDYAYAPSLMREGAGPEAVWQIWFCSTGDGRTWDFIRHARSADGARWSAPTVALRAAADPSERAACDPSVVRYRAPGDARPYYYVFYAGAPQGQGAAIFAARSETAAGPFAKWTGTDWRADGPAVPVIRAAAPRPDGSGFYGAGQPSVVVVDGALRAWFTDDTTCTPRCERVFETSSRDPTHWAERRATDVRLLSVDVKWDAAARRFVMLGIANPHAFGAFLARYVSADGIAWGRPEIVVPPTAFTHYAHNVGQAGDAEGHALPGDTLVMFGAPARPECGTCWARWDLGAGWLAAAPGAKP